MGFATLFLFTPRHERLYSRLGWATFDHADVSGLRVAVMERSLRWN